MRYYLVLRLVLHHRFYLLGAIYGHSTSKCRHKSEVARLYSVMVEHWFLSRVLRSWLRHGRKIIMLQRVIYTKSEVAFQFIIDGTLITLLQHH
jgi:hypothetical protein